MKDEPDPDLIRRKRAIIRDCASASPQACHAVFLNNAAHHRDWPSLHRHYLYLAKIVRKIGKLP